MSNDKKKLRNYAMYLLARRNYSCFEITKKMKTYVKRRDIDENLIQEVIDILLKHRYLDDEQYAAYFVDSRIRLKPRGAFLIKKELKMKGINETLIDKIISESGINEGEMAECLLDKKMRSWEELPQRKKQERAYRYLSSRGFRMETIYKAVNRCYGRDAK